MTFDTIHHWRLITKLFVIANAFVWWHLMGFAPKSLTYVVSHTHTAGSIPFYIFGVGLILLTYELFKTDHRSPEHIQQQCATTCGTCAQPRTRACWWGKPLVPFAYMALGGAYLVFAFMASLVPGAGVLAFNAVIQGLAAGWVAVLEKKNL